MHIAFFWVGVLRLRPCHVEGACDKTAKACQPFFLLRESISLAPLKATFLVCVVLPFVLGISFDTSALLVICIGS